MIFLDERESTNAHESGHLAAAVALGLEIVRVRLDIRWAPGGWRGHVETVRRAASTDPRQDFRDRRDRSVVARCGPMMEMVEPDWDRLPTTAGDRSVVFRNVPAGWTAPMWELNTEHHARTLMRTDAFRVAYPQFVEALGELGDVDEITGDDLMRIVNL